MVKNRSQLMIVLLAAGDVLATLAAWAIAYGLRALGGRMGWSHHATRPIGDFLPAILLSLLFVLLMFNRSGLYGPKRTKGLWVEVVDVARAVAIAWALTYVFANMLRGEEAPSRLMMASLLVSWLAITVAGRLGARVALRWARRRGLNLRWAAIIGAGRLGQKVFITLKRNAWTGIEPKYFIDGESGTGVPPVMHGRDAHATEHGQDAHATHQKLFDLDVLGPVDRVDELLRDQPVDIVFVALSSEHHEQCEAVLNRLATVNVDVRIIPDLLAFNFLQHDVTVLDNLSIITLTYSPQHGWNSLLKRVFDVAVSAVALVLLSPFLLAIALAVKLTSKGPIFYRQQRASVNGEPFTILKFRTMKADAEAETGAVWAAKDDPRVTRIGSLLRRSSLDELPQFFNVLVGQMSLVGPRPERPELIEQFRKDIPRYMLRHHVKAGLTGWAQIHGLRGNTSLRKRVQYDLYYITHWTFGLDLRILLLTPFRGLIHPNAY